MIILTPVESFKRTGGKSASTHCVNWWHCVIGWGHVRGHLLNMACWGKGPRRPWSQTARRDQSQGLLLVTCPPQQRDTTQPGQERHQELITTADRHQWPRSTKPYPLFLKEMPILISWRQHRHQDVEFTESESRRATVLTSTSVKSCVVLSPCWFWRTENRSW